MPRILAFALYRPDDAARLRNRDSCVTQHGRALQFLRHFHYIALFLAQCRQNGSNFLVKRLHGVRRQTQTGGGAARYAQTAAPNRAQHAAPLRFNGRSVEQRAPLGRIAELDGLSLRRRQPRPPGARRAARGRPALRRHGLAKVRAVAPHAGRRYRTCRDGRASPKPRRANAWNLRRRQPQNLRQLGRLAFAVHASTLFNYLI